jgi:hypothetical protein
MFEMTIIIRWIKPLRVISLLSAILYNLFYTISSFYLMQFYIYDENVREAAQEAHANAGRCILEAAVISILYMILV